jgi:surface polysaccharide O-acyltransferase-like enzyme
MLINDAEVESEKGSSTTVKRPTEHKRLYYIDMLRIIAIFLVIVIHVTGKHFYEAPLNSSRYFVFCLFDEFAHVAVPVFVMISGALFLDSAKEVPYRLILHKYLPRIVISYFVWGLVYALWECKYAGDASEYLLALACTIMRGPRHLWFLPMIAGLYLITPLMRTFTSNRQLLEAFLCLGLIFASIIPTIESIAVLYPNSGFQELFSAGKVLSQNVTFHFAMGYSLYYALGHYFHEYHKKTSVWLYVMGFIALSIGSGLTFWYSGISGVASVMFFNNFSVYILLGAIGLFCTLKDVFATISITSRIENLVAYVSSRVFGVYLVHLLVLNILDSIGFNSLMYNSAIVIPVLSVVIFAISFAVSALLGCIPMLRRWIV